MTTLSGTQRETLVSALRAARLFYVTHAELVKEAGEPLLGERYDRQAKLVDELCLIVERAQDITLGGALRLEPPQTSDRVLPAG